MIPEQLPIMKVSAMNTWETFLLLAPIARRIPISEETAAHIFDKFYQGDKSHVTAGNGLGLNIARRIAELHKGTVRLVSSSNALITFEVELSKDC